jgi:hypothetical protein
MADASRVWTEFTYMFNFEGIKAGCCGLCGGTGIIDTRGHVKTPKGFPAGILAYCICPNGRAAKKKEGLRKWDFLQLGHSILDAPERAE